MTTPSSFCRDFVTNIFTPTTRLVPCGLAAALAVASWSDAAERYTSQTVTPIGVGMAVAGTDINNAGKAVGVASSSFFDDLAFQPWLWSSASGPIDLVPGSAANQFFHASAINDAGAVIGNKLIPPVTASAAKMTDAVTLGLPVPIFSTSHAGFWATDGSGAFTPIPGLGPMLSLPQYGNSARAINSAGRVVGASFDGGSPMVPDSRAFLLDERGTLHNLSGIAGPGIIATAAMSINDANQICGMASVAELPGQDRVFFHDPRAGTMLLPTFTSPSSTVSESMFPMAMNGSGSIVGVSTVTTVVGMKLGFPVVEVHEIAFRWDRRSGLHSLAGITPLAINDAGAIVGYRPAGTPFGPGYHAVLLSGAQTIDLHTFIPLHSCSFSSVARAINNQGQILLTEQYCPDSIFIQFATHVLTPAPINPADLNGDGHVNGLDLALLLGSWGSASAADLNHDGVVNGLDLALLLGQWTG